MIYQIHRYDSRQKLITGCGMHQHIENTQSHTLWFYYSHTPGQSIRELPSNIDYCKIYPSLKASPYALLIYFTIYPYIPTIPSPNYTHLISYQYSIPLN
jgi:hypothetical protein